MIATMSLLCGCLLPGSGSSDALTAGGGELSDGAFRLYFNPGEQWDMGGCYTLDLLYTGSTLEDWRANITLDAAVDTWTFLDPLLVEEGDDQLQWALGSDATIDTDGWLGSSSYCSEPAAIPALLNVWAIEESDGESAASTFSSKTLEDSTGRVWVTVDDAGDQGEGDCMVLEVVNLSSDVLQSWQLDLTMSNETEVTDTFNAYALAQGDVITVRPTSAAALATYESWDGWICLSPFAQPVAAALTNGGVDE
ncbi:MAG: hypothetical protein ACI8S6_004158 [Myxococcota bacterium]|jgi:hypothetical protein